VAIDNSLAGRTVLVTGAASGFGLVMGGLSAREPDPRRRRGPSGGLGTPAVRGSVDILVNNAGVAPSIVRRNFVVEPVRFWEHTEEHTQNFFAVNAIAPFA
jgi:NAD(P)-dependent dehydrogenase (short-subunit alcohol dehydrogenase family)